LFAAVTAGSLWAHHSTSAIFDLQKKITLTGTLMKVNWVNPHINIALHAKGENGAMEDWVFEASPPAWFRSVGINKVDFSKGIGQDITVVGSPARDGAKYAYLEKITFADGRSFESFSQR
jgi:hypothetical protein